jgi:hypothetical protein
MRRQDNNNNKKKKKKKRERTYDFGGIDQVVQLDVARANCRRGHVDRLCCPRRCYANHSISKKKKKKMRKYKIKIIKNRKISPGLLADTATLCDIELTFAMIKKRKTNRIETIPEDTANDKPGFDAVAFVAAVTGLLTELATLVVRTGYSQTKHNKKMNEQTTGVSTQTHHRNANKTACKLVSSSFTSMQKTQTQRK